MPFEPNPVHMSPERDSCELYLGTSKPESRYGGRWILILEFPECDTYSAFYSIGSPFRDNPYEHELVHDGQCSEYLRDFDEVILIGVVQQERFRAFLEAFYDTRPGPDQYFVLRVVFALWEQGLVESIVLDIFLNQPGLQYSAGEKEYHYYHLATMDYLFFEDLKKCGFLVQRRAGEAKMEDKAGMRWWLREKDLLGCSSCLDYFD
ncbi:predicted protein [Aspergillus nidulans FGSC A4]|uniref:Uncharacterized protein n=1 Tax=Emericella nidulans (strain FGSC A4 / ATCC 38163 / CBS 112.46 / NRRL 194 / M139) TaxID=227321 RepID=Q5ATJ5_EMENI|nr:hypothetical protein [Aspergillus nidulans FGSC A4]EAA67007.1 predicted protein [Aspergillus nidulans FGSC A4]CBF80432.1 TPA: conserved hypothetical protein [Aspergillus nidulans FGSC A4]|eukprot:XP_681654.1 predicted protein [Aspergillus nidulans FGSC A4]